MDMKKVVIVYSGGLDSTVMLYHAVDLFGKKNVEAVTFDYGSKHNSKEIECAEWNARELGVKHTIFNLSDVIGKHFKSSLLQKGGKIPYGHYAAENMKETVVPLRNGIMLMIAAGYADSHGFSEVWIASHSGDHFVYADCRVAFNRALNLAIREGTEQRVSLAAPFNSLYKQDIVRKGEQLGVPFEKTWSCYEGNLIPCWKCGTCTERAEAFDKAGISDSLRAVTPKRKKAKKNKPNRDWTYNVSWEETQHAWKLTRACIIRLNKKGIPATQVNIEDHTTCFTNPDGSFKKRLWGNVMKFYGHKLSIDTIGNYKVYHVAGKEPNLKRWIPIDD